MPRGALTPLRRCYSFPPFGERSAEFWLEKTRVRNPGFVGGFGCGVALLALGRSPTASSPSSNSENDLDNGGLARLLIGPAVRKLKTGRVWVVQVRAPV